MSNARLLAVILAIIVSASVILFTASAMAQTKKAPAKKSTQSHTKSVQDEAAPNPEKGNGCGGFGKLTIEAVEYGTDRASPPGTPTKSDFGKVFRLPLSFAQDRMQSMAHSLSVYVKGAEYVQNPKARERLERTNFFVPGGDLYKAMDALDDDTMRTCFPKFYAYVQKLNTNFNTAEAQRTKQEEFDNSPYGKIFKAYQHWVAVSYCSKVREGYLSVYISDTERERAEKVVKQIVSDAKAQDSSIDLDVAWKDAMESMSGFPASRDFCQVWYRRLLEKAPSADAYDIRRPQ